MNGRIDELIENIHRLEDELEAEFRARRAAFEADFEQRRVHFAAEVLEQQRRFKVGLAEYLLKAQPRHVISAPIIYAVSVPLLLLDIFASIYQWTCFPLYGVPRVPRRDYFIYDRGALAYLNALEKVHCVYCSYATGLLGYLREIIGRTEQYWCPIKHARRVLVTHGRYKDFLDYGDAEHYRQGLEALREKLHAERANNHTRH